jgi:hypothetical protein
LLTSSTTKNLIKLKTISIPSRKRKIKEKKNSNKRKITKKTRTGKQQQNTKTKLINTKPLLWKFTFIF